MPTELSRRELIAWLAAGTGTAATGTSLWLNRPTDSSRRDDESGAPIDSAASTRDAPASQPTAGASTSATSIVADRLLVVVEMPGGNDGLSMTVPYGNGTYYDLRDRTAIPEEDVLDLDGSNGLHPNLVNLHRRGVTLVDGVGSFDPDGSHFEMSARWWAGDSTEASNATGWIGRVADVLAADGELNGPAAALSVGSGAHPIIRSATGSTVSMPSADALWAVAGAEEDDLMRSSYQRALRSFAEVETPIGPSMRDGLAFADRMVELGLDEDDADDLGYEGWGLGQSLQFAASIFAGDVGVRMIHVQTAGGYDTHDGHDYDYPELMREFDTNLGAFHRDIEARGLGDRVMVMTTSEFGRTLKENSNGGLDHGTASTLLLSGPGTDGRVGELPSLTDRDENDDLKASMRFESYLGGVVESWLGVPSSEIFDPEVEPLHLFT